MIIMELIIITSNFVRSKLKNLKNHILAVILVRFEPELSKCITIEDRKGGENSIPLVNEALSKAIEETTQQASAPEAKSLVG